MAPRSITHYMVQLTLQLLLFRSPFLKWRLNNKIQTNTIKQWYQGHPSMDEALSLGGHLGLSSATKKHVQRASSKTQKANKSIPHPPPTASLVEPYVYFRPSFTQRSNPLSGTILSSWVAQKNLVSWPRHQFFG